MKKYCLATVTSEEFVPGTIVMLASFLDNNPWFDGDIVIIHHSLPAAHRRLFECFEHVTFRPVSQRLDHTLRDLAQALPGLGLEQKMPRFYSLEAFLIPDYERVFYFDSDILFISNVSALCETERGRLMCCGDSCHYRDLSRDAHSFLPIKPDSEGSPLRHTFNSGVMVIDDSLRTPQNYQGLTDLLTPAVWKSIRAPHTDQVVLNLYFQDLCTILDGRYNFLVPFAHDIFEYDGFTERDIYALHFLGRTKPWNLGAVLETTAEAGEILRYHRDWHQYWHRFYMDWLPKFHLRGKISKWRSDR